MSLGAGIAVAGIWLGVGLVGIYDGPVFWLGIFALIATCSVAENSVVIEKVAKD